MFKKNGSMTGKHPGTTIIIFLMIFRNHGVPRSSSLIDLRVSGATFPANSIHLDDHIRKAWEYGMVAYHVEISDLKYPFFSSLTKFPRCTLKRIH